MIKSYCKMIILLYNECMQGYIMNLYIIKIKDKYMFKQTTISKNIRSMS